ncbi:MAG TPA: arginine deiminase-related protein [Saprospiraceae bacterium]|nr:amidinotransferase [Saprospiraceae bacterium]MCC6687445.1 amidinotransferase [Saprospiraceae bacterium]HMV24080.1 arginine deiminase-related protein [Saprospiraceae bacterium]HMX83782.1 arginine deiminase-related protein [Saprospiraceae bacterium]HMX86207.1 arginine deiminase-related protein [Saprospiraceae bacterium]
MLRKQVTRSILMVRPSNFGFNEETAVNNAFQNNAAGKTSEQIREKAIEEFDSFVSLLRSKGVDVSVYQDEPQPIKPDAVFPNNWVSFHEDGTVITYPMFAKVRRIERTDKVFDLLEPHFWILDHIHLEQSEEDNIFLEGTGSMVLDRANKIAYACISPRTEKTLFEDWCNIYEYAPVSFTAIDQEGKLIYHTNVMMAMGDKFVVICLESVIDDEEKSALREIFARTEKEIIEISLEQMNAFAGNMLQVQGASGQTYLVMSKTAFGSLNASQIEKIEKYTEILTADINTIETYGGGSVRCMMAEIFLPEKSLA